MIFINNNSFSGYNSKLKPQSRYLRKYMTPKECRLWYFFLRTYPVKIYRQRSIDKYIVDFYCSKASLIIEIDGSQHFTDEGVVYDKIRTDILESYNLKVIRFTNIDINSNFSGVCEYIDKAINENLYKKDVYYGNQAR